MRRSALCVLALLAVAVALPAQNPAPPAPPPDLSRTTKFFVGGGINGSAIDIETDDEVESGSGIAIGLGYGFTPVFALFAELAVAAIDAEEDTYGLAHFDLGARFHFANPARKWTPFLETALTGRTASQNDVQICDAFGCEIGDLSFSGAGFTFGGGVMYYATPKLAISGSLKWTTGEFTDVTFGGDTVSDLEMDATTTRFNLGVVWFPNR